MPLQWLNLTKTLATFVILNATSSLVQNISRIVCLSFAFLLQVTHYLTTAKIFLQIYRLKIIALMSLRRQTSRGGVEIIYHSAQKAKLPSRSLLFLLPVHTLQHHDCQSCHSCSSQHSVILDNLTVVVFIKLCCLLS